MWHWMPLEVGRVTKSLLCFEPLLWLMALAIAHGWRWCQSGGSQSGVSNRPVRPSCVRAGSVRWGDGQAIMCIVRVSYHSS